MILLHHRVMGGSRFRIVLGCLMLNCLVEVLAHRRGPGHIGGIGGEIAALERPTGIARRLGRGAEVIERNPQPWGQ